MNFLTSKIKDENIDHYLCADYTEEKYSWFLEDIDVLETPIKPNGQLSILNYDPNNNNNNNERWLKKWEKRKLDLDNLIQNLIYGLSHK